MSYDIVRSLSINIDKKKASGSSASSNLHPKTFERWEYTYKRKGNGIKHFSDKEMFLGGLLKDLDGGIMKLTSSVGVKYRYALYKMKEYADKTYGKQMYYILDGLYKDEPTSKNVAQIKDILKRYEYLLKLKDKKVNVVGVLNNGSYYYKHSSRRIWSTPYKSAAKKITSYKEMELLKVSQGMIKEFEDV